MSLSDAKFSGTTGFDDPDGRYFMLRFLELEEGLELGDLFEENEQGRAIRAFYREAYEVFLAEVEADDAAA